MTGKADLALEHKMAEYRRDPLGFVGFASPDDGDAPALTFAPAGRQARLGPRTPLRGGPGEAETMGRVTAGSAPLQWRSWSPGPRASGALRIMSGRDARGSARLKAVPRAKTRPAP